MIGKTFEDIGKAQFFCFWGNKGHQKNIMGVKNNNVLIGENKISYFRSNESGHDFVNNLDMIMDY